jgi:predicted RNA binding protein YcfA (HicA-like mRNA interferase family)
VSRLLDQRTAIKLLQRDGWALGRGGKHVVKMVKPGMRPVTLPHHRGQCYGKRLTHAIADQ